MFKKNAHNFQLVKAGSQSLRQYAKIGTYYTESVKQKNEKMRVTKIESGARWPSTFNNKCQIETEQCFPPIVWYDLVVAVAQCCLLQLLFNTERYTCNRQMPHSQRGSEWDRWKLQTIHFFLSTHPVFRTHSQCHSRVREDFSAGYRFCCSCYQLIRSGKRVFSFLPLNPYAVAG